MTLSNVNDDLRRLTVAIEMHEAKVWADCFDAAAALPGNPLGATVDRSATPPLALSRSIGSVEINRVVGLGLVSPATQETVSAVMDFYRLSGQSTFRIELSPAASPPDLAQALEMAGLRLEDDTVTKMWCSTEQVPSPSKEVEVRRLGREHRNAVAELNVIAWGAWEAADSLRLWFGSTVGTKGFRHYGIFDGDRLVSVGALAVTGSLGWVGFAATHPHYRGHSFRRSINLVRLAEARELGCQIVHVEIETAYASSPKLPFEKLCERVAYSPVQ